MKPNLILVLGVLTMLAWGLPIYIAAHQTWKAREWKRLYDTANAQSELAAKWKHEQHKNP